jgi:hypothetical protein
MGKHFDFVFIFMFEKYFLKKLFYLFILNYFFSVFNCFNMLMSKIIKNIILIYFQTKNTLKNNYYGNTKSTLSFNFNKFCLVLTKHFKIKIKSKPKCEFIFS